jgi:uncharacterized membrane protein YcaP (DUF421 family)
LSLIVLFRVILKRQAGSLGLPDVMLVVLVSESVAGALSPQTRSISTGLATVLGLLFWNYTLDRLAHRWPWLHRLLERQPLELVRDGKLLRKNLDQEGITEDELAAQLRLNGIDDVAKAKLAMMESEGEVSVIARDPPAPPSRDEQSPDGDLALESVTRKFLQAEGAAATIRGLA